MFQRPSKLLSSVTSHAAGVGTRGERQLPLRVEILARDKLDEFARTLAEEHEGRYAERRGRNVFQRFRENTAALELAYFEFALAAKADQPLAPGAEWLLDNYHVIEEHVRDIRRHLPRGYYRSLPKLIEGEHAGNPRVYHVAVEIICHTDSILTREVLTTFVSAYQARLPLAIGELWAIPIMLRLGLIENLRRLALVSLEAKADREEIDQALDAVLTDPSSTGSDALLMLAGRLKDRRKFSMPAAVHALRRLRALGSKGHLSRQWLEERLKEQGSDPEEIVRVEHQLEAANQITIGNCVTSLRTLSSLNWRSWVEELSAVDQILRGDPSYAMCDFETRDAYRHRIERYARHKIASETEIATAALELAADGRIHVAHDGVEDARERHVGYYLIDDGQESLERRIVCPPPWSIRLQRALKRRAFVLYLAGIAALAIAIEAGLARLFAGYELNTKVVALTLFSIPAISLAIDIVHWLVTRFLSPRVLPKLSFEEGILAEWRTAVTVHTIFQDEESIARAVELLEVRYLGNSDSQLSFVLLADLPNAPAASMPADAEIIHFARDRIAGLNARYCTAGRPQFALLLRRRRWNPAESAFMGWERKRGKVMEFNRLLLGDDRTTFDVLVGDLRELRKHCLVITLDGDSQLPRGVGALLVGTSAHPLNRPVISPDTNTVVKGYAIVQPRIGTSLTSANVSIFSRIFSGYTGLDPYTHAVSDIYQDLFGEGTYVGKGIYDVRAFDQVLRGRVPENALLSHDLFESTFARTGLATDIELIDDFPSRYNTHSRRLHRWMRGDWQLLPWLLPLVPNEERSLYPNPISALGRWKIFDNLRRSLLAPFLLAAAVFTWLVAPPLALAATGFILLLLTFPVYTTLFNALLSPPIGVSADLYARGIGRLLMQHLAQTVLQLSFLPYQGYLAFDAVLVTLYRTFHSHRNLLEWQTAYHTERQAGLGIHAFLSELSPGVVLALGASAAVAISAPESLPAAVPLLLLWIFSPLLAWRISLPLVHSSRALNAEQRALLVDVARDTWGYFDDHLIERYNYLIPDNLQLIPVPTVAERTSPTNIALSILAAISAYDLGFTPLAASVERLRKIFQTLAKLERYYGHFLNWYQVVTLDPLRPRYVSTVDSGNFAGHLIAARVALEQFRNAPLCSPHYSSHLIARIRKSLLETAFEPNRDGYVGRLEGMQFSTAGELLSASEGADRIATELRENVLFAEGNWTLLSELDQLAEQREFLSWLPGLAGLEEVLPDTPLREELRLRLQEVRSTPLSLSALRSLIFAVSDTCQRIAEGASPEIGSRLDSILADLRTSQMKVELLLESIDSLIRDCATYVDEMDFQFLFDSEKMLFVIGYNVDDARRDNSYYDLLASEARLGSFVAIAKGDIPQRHWFMLGRMLADSQGGKALLSWSATMFEYLMPLLVMKDFPGTLLSESYRAVVRAQRVYGWQRHVPWGVSESGYSGVDFEKTYQYRAFGVPGLGLKRGLSEDLVVSPYSTFLALPIAPAECIANIAALQEAGLRGRYGFYEAIDYTKERLTKDESGHVVQSFLGHHQGMILASINNFVNEGIFEKRFHSDSTVKATELLLQERFPERIPAIVPHQAELSFIEREKESALGRDRKYATPHTRLPVAHVLSNTQYAVVIDNEGSGYSMVDRTVALTRWREDSCANQFGSYIYVRDLDSGDLWSATYQPTLAEPEYYEAFFNPDKAEFKRVDHGITLHTEITVSPEDNIEVRRITAHNLSAEDRTLELTSYSEVVLGSARGDIAHPAFSKMFVETEFLSDYDALLFSRRPRSDREERLYLLHMLVMNVVWDRIRYETSRARFLGRGRSAMSPAAFETALSESVGSVLDPVAVLRTRLELSRGESAAASFITGFAKSREEALHLAQKYREGPFITRAFEMAWSQSNVEIRFEQFSLAQTFVFQDLMSAILFNHSELRADPQTIAANRLMQSNLWRFGISGDQPIVLLRLSDASHFSLLREALLAHDYLKARLFDFDLVILNEYPGGYLQRFQEEIESHVRMGNFGSLGEQQRGVFIRNLGQLSGEEINLLKAVARVILDGEKGPLVSQLGQPTRGDVLPVLPRERMRLPALPAKPVEGEFANGIGAFVDGGHAYRLRVTPSTLPPLPWSNVIASSAFGFLVTESGGGYTWSQNSRENRLTPWTNDPIADGRGEALYIRDLASLDYFSPTPLPATGDAPYEVTHGFGYTSFATEHRGIRSLLHVFPSADYRVKWWKLRLLNTSSEERECEVVLFLDWILGIVRQDSYRQIVTDFDAAGNFLYAVNRYNNEFAESHVFVGCRRELQSFTTDRLEFLGRHRDLAAPVALEAFAPVSVENMVLTGLSSLIGRPKANLRLSRRVGAGFESCAALVTTALLKPGVESEIAFFLGEAPSLAEARKWVNGARTRNSNELESTTQYFTDVVNDIVVRTPDRSFDLLLNGWLCYQTFSCRINGRSALYQSGGAFGFRDQLQDVLAFLFTRPELIREQVLLHASRQFVEGDVQHWWHPPTGRGVRTRISDDYLWLPFAVARYVEVTGDTGLLREDAPYIEARALEEHEMEAYLVPTVSSRVEDVYGHCIAALERSIIVGPHGLPLMGGGDWNDGMNEVGHRGQGESVWLGWFLAVVLRNFAPLCSARGEDDRAARYRTHADRLCQNIDTHAWDGEWYRRAYFDDGTPLGSRENDECQIDSLAQSWSIIAGSRERGRRAMASVYERLVREKERIILLLDPPFDRTPLNPGYIKGYLPGLRENGGQYTHAATWTVLATALLGDGDRAFELFSLLNPVNHTRDRESLERYRTEPYVLCGDVYSVEPLVGHGGWSWYTGSAGWLYRVGLEHILGLNVYGGTHFTVNPCIPSQWKEFSLTWTRDGTKYVVEVNNPDAVHSGVKEVTVDGTVVPDGKIPFGKVRGGEVIVNILLG